MALYLRQRVIFFGKGSAARCGRNRADSGGSRPAERATAIASASAKNAMRFRRGRHGRLLFRPSAMRHGTPDPGVAGKLRNSLAVAALFLSAVPHRPGIPRR